MFLQFKGDGEEAEIYTNLLSCRNPQCLQGPLYLAGRVGKQLCGCSQGEVRGNAVALSNTSNSLLIATLSFKHLLCLHEVRDQIISLRSTSQLLFFLSSFSSLSFFLIKEVVSIYCVQI